MRTEKKRDLKETFEHLGIICHWPSHVKRRRAAKLAVNLGQESPGTPLLVEYLEEGTNKPCEAIGYLYYYNPGELNILLDDSKVKDSEDSFHNSPKYAHHKIIRIYEVEKYYRLKKIQPNK